MVSVENGRQSGDNGTSGCALGYDCLLAVCREPWWVVVDVTDVDKYSSVVTGPV